MQARDPRHQAAEASLAASEAKALSERIGKHIDQVDAEYVRRWREAKTAADREQLWALQQALRDFRSHLESVMKGGDVVAFNLRRHLAGAPKRG